jgi:hypothetical protein
MHDPSDPSGQQQTSPPFAPSPEQALAVYTSSGEAHRFVVGQMWQVTYLVLLAYAALAAAPPLIGEDVADLIWIAANSLCAVLAPVIARLASMHLRNLHQTDTRHLERVYKAAKELQLVLDLHGWKAAPRPGRRICALMTAVLFGALLTIGINLSRIPWARIYPLLCAP